MSSLCPEVRPVRVLCVDDNRDVADSTALLLQIVGCDALACYDGPTALRVATTFRPCICVLDLNLPGMDGDELGLRLRRLSGDHPLVLLALTAANDCTSRARTRAAGFELHLTKPVDPGELLTAVDRFSHVCNPAR